MNKNWHRIKQYFRQYKVKLTVSMFLCSIVPLIAMGVLAYNYSYKIGVDRILQTTVRSDDQINIQLNNRINQVESTAITLQYEVYTLLNSQDDLSKSLSAFNNVRNNVSLYNSAFDFFHTYIFLPDYIIGSEEGLTFFSTDELYTLDINVDTIRSLSNTSYWFYQNKIFLPSTLLNDNDSDCVGCIKALNNKSTKSTDYVIVIYLQPRELSNILKTTFSDDEISSFITNSDGEIMAHTDQSLLGSSLPQSYVKSITSNGSVFYKDSIHYHVVLLDNGWYHFTEIPQSYINTNIHSLLTAILIIFIITVSAVIVLTLLLTRNLSQRVSALSDAMKSFHIGTKFSQEQQHQLVRALNEQYYDDFDHLGLRFIEMNNSINENMTSIINLSISEEKLKYKLLQSQINPHFLYNILGSINNCISLGKLDIANNMVLSLSQFYRLSLSKSGEMIQIRDELEMSRLYLELEKLCHDGTLDWTIHYDDGIENYYICKFTLQPFLENSIHYGYSPSITSIHISVDVKYGDDKVIIMIKDDGKGIDNDTLDNLKKTMATQTINYSKYFGIGNVCHRIASPVYGNGHIEVENCDSGGALITITIDQIDEYRDDDL